MANNKSKSVARRNKRNAGKSAVKKANQKKGNAHHKMAPGIKISRPSVNRVSGKDRKQHSNIRNTKRVGHAVSAKNNSMKQKINSGKAGEQTRKRKAKFSINIPSVEESRRVLNIISSNQEAVNYITKNISKRVLDVLNLLEEPMSDEEIAQTLDLKINAVRRILNIAQEYGITNYYVTKNTNGWLSFAWYINANKLPYFLDYISSNNEVKSVINDDCNDYFICKSCYGKDKVVFTFDAAFENNFKCNVCSTEFIRMDREEAKRLIYPSIESKKGEEAIVPNP